MAGTSQIFGTRIVRDRSQYGGDTVSRRDTGRHALLRFYRDRERGAVTALIITDHRRQIELSEFFIRQTQADDATAIADQARHGFDADFFCSQNQIRFIFAIEIIHQQYRTAQPQILQCSLQTFWPRRLGVQGVQIVTGRSSACVSWGDLNSLINLINLRHR